MTAELSLKRIEESQDLLLFFCGQLVEALLHLFRFIAVAFNRVGQAQGLQVMHEPRPHAQSPERRSAQLVGRVLLRRLHDTVARADVVQQEIAVGMDNLVAESLRHGERAAVDGRAGRRSHNCAHVARAAADRFEDGLARLGVRRRRQHHIAWRHFRAADELRKVIDVRQPESVGNVPPGPW